MSVARRRRLAFPGKVVCPAGVLVLDSGVKALGPCVLLSELTVP